MNRAVLYWLPMPVIGTMNGLFRGLILMRFMSEFYARQISSVMLIALLFFYTNAIFQKLQIRTISAAFSAGCTWMVLTIAFEVLLGWVILHQRIDVLWREYNVLEGNLWSLVLMSILFLPCVLFKFKMHGKKNASELK